jgi:hypothetical protein
VSNKQDANDILRAHGPDALRDALDRAATIGQAKPPATAPPAPAPLEHLNGAAPAKRKGGVAARPAEPVRFKTLAEFCDEYVPLAYAVEGIVRTNTLYCLTAKPGAGKTGFMVATALAIATGRADILGIEVAQGRVLYLAGENPDDVRMRFKIAAYLLNVDIRGIGDSVVIRDRRDKPEDVLVEIDRRFKDDPRQTFTAVFVDTYASYFDGSDVSNPVEAGEFTRRLRPFTKVPGLPAVIVGAHPVKNASEGLLVPYGAGAILGEIDGNLCLWKEGDTTSLHWQGKLRGVDFTPVPFRFEISSSPDICDIKGRQVQLPTIMPASSIDIEDRDARAIATDIKLLRAMTANPSGSQLEWAISIQTSKANVNRLLKKLVGEKMVEVDLGRHSLTKKAKTALEKVT